MNQIHDLLGSIIIGGIVLLMLLAFNGNVMQSAGTQTFKTIVQSNLTAVTDILEFDIRKMGYRLSATQDSAVVLADSNRITFRGDIDDNGVVDQVQYYIDTVTAYLTNNPRDRVLHRRLNNGPPVNMYLGMIGMKIQYYGNNDSPITNTPLANTNSIKSVKVSISIESKDRFFDNRKSQYISNPFNDTTYAGAYWERKIKPQNMR